MLKAFWRPRTFPLLVAGVFLASASGCGKGDGKLVPVQGTVKLGDAPLTTGMVIFRPDASKGNTSQHEPRGQIDAEGHYKLMTAQREGVAPGWYKVGITASQPSTDANNPYAILKSLIPSIYNDPEKSRLALEVVEKPNPGAYDLTIRK
ncbi:MAG TPA: hypothetical protein VH575_23675 [Gemmataceae bacterium]|jgi:hypothetical protein